MQRPSARPWYLRKTGQLVIGIFVLLVSTITPTVSFARQAAAGDDSLPAQAQAWPVISKSNLDQLQPVYSLDDHTQGIAAIAISPDGELLASGSSDGELRIWEIATGETVVSIQAHEWALNSLDWSPDGSTIASSTTDRFVKLWDPSNGELRDTIEARLMDYVLKVQFTPDGDHLAIAGPECLVVLRDAENGILYKTYHQRGCRPRSGGSIYSWGIDFDSASDELLLGFSQPACNCGSIQRWGMEVIATNELVYGYNLPVDDLVLSPDGKDIAITMVATSFIRVIDAESIYPLRDLHGHHFRVNSVNYSPDGDLLASGSNDRRVGLWDTESGELLRFITGHSDAVTQVQFSPDATYLVSSSKDGLVIVWAVTPEG